MWKEHVKEMKHNGSAEKWLHSHPRPLCSSWKTNPKHSPQKSAATAGQWWSLHLHVVLTLLHLALWGAPGVSLPAIWRKNWYWDHSQGFSLQREMDLNQDSEVLLSASPNTPSRCETERRGAQAPPPAPRAALSPSLPWTPGGLWGWLFLKEPKQAWQKLPTSLLCL